MIFKPFLNEYQVDKPLMLSLAKNLQSPLRKAMARFLKCSVLSASTGIVSLLKTDISDLKHHALLEKVDIGHAVG